MFARKIRMKLNPSSAIEFSRLYEQQVLPVLRQQPGFCDGMTLVSGERAEAVAISFWDKRADADNFGDTAYAALIDGLAGVLAEAPEVSTLVVSNSTPHQVAVRN